MPTKPQTKIKGGVRLPKNWGKMKGEEGPEVKTKERKVKAWLAVQTLSGPRKWGPLPTVNPWICTSRPNLVIRLKKEEFWGMKYFTIVPCTITYKLPLRTK